MSNPLPPQTESTPSISGLKVPLLIGAVLALIVASIYTLYQLGQFRDELNQARDEASQARRELAEARNEFVAEITRLHESSSISNQANKDTVDSLRVELEAARRQARSLLGEAKVEATKQADQLATKLAKAQEEQAARVAAMSDAVSQVKTDADATKTRVGQVSSEVGVVKTSLDATKSELEKTIADLKSTKGDLGMQSGLIATNAKELAALKTRGERAYVEFRIPKEKVAQKVGDLWVRLKTADPRRNRYTVEVLVDDKRIEKKDKTTNEPVQFILAGYTEPIEIVVNEVKKDLILGYVAEPKAKPARK